MKFECKICDLTFESAHAMRMHFRSYAHREKASMNDVDVMLNKFTDLVKKLVQDEPDKI